MWLIFYNLQGYADSAALKVGSYMFGSFLFQRTAAVVSLDLCHIHYAPIVTWFHGTNNFTNYSHESCNIIYVPAVQQHAQYPPNIQIFLLNTQLLELILLVTFGNPTSGHIALLFVGRPVLHKATGQVKSCWCLFYSLSKNF